MNSFRCGFEATRRSHEAEVARRAENARKLAAYPALVAACRATLDRLSAWTDGAKVAQIAAETRQDRHEAEGYWNTVQNYTVLMDSLSAALAAAGESTEPKPHEFITDMRQDGLA